MRPRWIFLVTTLILSKSVFSATSDRIVDPYADENLNCHEKPDGRLRYLSKSFGFDYFRIRADLNFDGREDVILTTEDPSCGNGGCSTAVYLKQSDGSYAVAYLGLHPEKVRLRRGKNGGGEIQTYWTDTASTGVALTFTVTTDAIVETESIRVSADKTGSKSDVSATNDGVLLRAEYASCKNETLQWAPLP